jgi:hypothetical protein
MKDVSACMSRDSRVAKAIASGLKSTPTTEAPRFASDIESMPKWHIRCRMRLPRTSPMPAFSIACSEPPVFLKRATS